MTQWSNTVVDRSVLYSPVGLQLIDELTGEAPLGIVIATLDISDPPAGWRETDLPAVNTPGGVVTYPGLEFHQDLSGRTPTQYRVRLSADLYIPYYQINADGIVFQAFPYNDDNPPAMVTKSATDTPLLPSPNYPFADHIPVLRGMVVDGNNQRVPNVYVTQANRERAVTDANGNFALPLRWVAPNPPPAPPRPTPVDVDATDQRTGRTGTITIQFPDALTSSQTIAIH